MGEEWVGQQVKRQQENDCLPEEVDSHDGEYYDVAWAAKKGTSAKTIYSLPCLPGLYGLPWLTPGFLDICKNDF